MATDVVFSEFEVDKASFKFNEGTAEALTCIGKFEEEMEVKTVTKKCRGKVIKTRTRGTGNGTIKTSMHVPKGTYAKLFAMERENLIKGAYAFGENSLLPECCMCVHVTDEDGKEKLKAYPRVTATTGPARTVENGGDEVEEIEPEFSVMPDSNGEGMYELFLDDVDDSKKKTIVDSWMTDFTPDLVDAAKQHSADTAGSHAVNTASEEKGE